MSETTTEQVTTRDRVIAEAETYGWKVRHFPSGDVILSRSHRTLTINFGVRGGITYASTSDGIFAGDKKKERVLNHIQVWGKKKDVAA
jgi:hypothetical protein